AANRDEEAGSSLPVGSTGIGKPNLESPSPATAEKRAWYVDDRAVEQLYQGDLSLAAQQVKFAADPARRTAFIHRLKNSPVNAAVLAEELRASRDPALRSALCL